jgi:uncharacterized protein (TIGR02271 family)
MQHTLVAVFDNRGDAQSAMDELIAGGFPRQEVRLSDSDPTGAPTGADTSAGDHSVGSGIKHFFSNLFGTDNSEHTQKYSDAVTRGHVVLTVTAVNEAEVERAADVVERHGPVDIDDKVAQWSGGAVPGEAMRASTGAQQKSAPMSQQSMQGAKASVQGTTQGSEQRAATSEATAIPVIQEELRVGKRVVQRGSVRVFQHIVETPVNETVSLREEHVNVERRPVDKPVSSADMAAFEEKSIELRETAEEAVVQKSARVIEEVVVGKEASQHQEQISDTVRHTEVEVERLDADAASGAAGADDTYYRSHYDSNYASGGGRYEDYAPAYRYGTSMAGSDQYRGRQWNDVEPGLRSDWEARNPGSAWEKIKAAVRHGWEKITS